MHELYLAQDILRKAQEKAQAQVKNIKISLGRSRFTHLEELKELLADLMSKTELKNAKVEFEIVPLKSACADCGTEFTPEKMRLTCARCGSGNIQITSGDALAVEVS